MKKELLFIDTETGGLDPKECGLCSVSLKVFDADIKDTFFIKPNESLLYNKSAIDINNISMETLQNEGISEIDAVFRIIRFCTNNFKGKPLLAGQNVSFDKRFIEELFERCEHSLHHHIHYHIIDTMIISYVLKFANILPELVPTKLSEMYKFLLEKTDEDITNAHDAEFDVHMTEQVFKEQLQLLRRI